MERVILDTNVLIEAERTGRLDQSLDFDDVAIAAVSLAELHEGVLGARRRGDNATAERREAFVERVAIRVQVLPYSRETAAEHGALLDYVRATGKPRGIHDLLIAAHARETGRAIVSADRKARFNDLPGVRLR
ncbi:MAG: PIN domain-containing protein [Promicromonosporaceae bacterium]|nr:PIN domain-containing protein [Promicromonosporaceae bacterium]